MDEEVQLPMFSWAEIMGEDVPESPISEADIEDIYDQQSGESVAEWEARLDRLRDEAFAYEAERAKTEDRFAVSLEAHEIHENDEERCVQCSQVIVNGEVRRDSTKLTCPNCYQPTDSFDPLPGETDIQYDQRVDQQRDEIYKCADFYIPPGDQSNPKSDPQSDLILATVKAARATACPPPATPQTLEALQEMARVALESIEREKREKRQTKHQMKVLSETGVTYIQESFVPSTCTAEGGTGDDCMMCNGQACRFCGAGCWNNQVKDCAHNETQRHQWDPDVQDLRTYLQDAEVRMMVLTEPRRQEMLRKIFDGEPRPYNAVYCIDCKQRVQTGEMVNITSAGSRHLRCPT